MQALCEKHEGVAATSLGVLNGVWNVVDFQCLYGPHGAPLGVILIPDVCIT